MAGSSCCFSETVGDPFDHDYVHHGTMVTAPATLLGTTLTLIVALRVFVVFWRMTSSKTRENLEKRIDENKRQLRRLDEDLSRIHQSPTDEESAPYLSPRLDPPSEPRQQLQEPAARIQYDDIDNAIRHDQDRIRFCRMVDSRPNHLMMACILMQLLTSVVMGVSAMMTLFNSVHVCCSALPGVDSPSTSQQCASPRRTYALSPSACSWSATAVNYTYVSANACIGLFLGHILIARPPHWLCSVAFIHVIALATTLVNFGFFFHRSNDHFAYSRTLAWCWIPDPHEATNHHVSPQVAIALQFVSAYVAIPVLGLVLLGARRRLYREFRTEFSLKSVNQRLLPPIAFLAFETIADIACRSFRRDEGVAVWSVPLAITSFLFPFTGAVTAFVWAFGEGLSPQLIPSRQANEDFGVPRYDFEPFSSLVYQLWKNEARRRAFDRSCTMERQIVSEQDSGYFHVSSGRLHDDGGSLARFLPSRTRADTAASDA
mmetsp:Transcript_44829/g.138299  ORF Transcript_44829/g.138299 Transcript_44829/m.138299 type:complete len:488 (-) Transcript_44829:92-1555(-)